MLIDKNINKGIVLRFRSSLFTNKPKAKNLNDIIKIKDYYTQKSLNAKSIIMENEFKYTLHAMNNKEYLNMPYIKQ